MYIQSLVLGSTYIALGRERVQFVGIRRGEPTYGVVCKQAIMFLTVGKRWTGRVAIDFFHSYHLITQ
jgi:hypothetical protein